MVNLLEKLNINHHTNLVLHLVILLDESDCPVRFLSEFALAVFSVQNALEL